MTQAIRACVIFLLLCLGRWRGDTKGQKSQKKQKFFISFMARKQCAGYKKLLFLLRLLSFCISLTRLHVDSLDYRVVAGVVKHLDGIRHYPQV